MLPGGPPFLPGERRQRLASAAPKDEQNQGDDGEDDENGPKHEPTVPTKGWQ